MKNIIYGKISIEIVSLLGLALVIILMTSTVSAGRTEPLIIDHNCANLSEIPDEWIDQAKTDLHIAYQHTSHGSQLITGMNALENFPSFGTKYEWSDNGASGLDLDDYGIPGCADLSQGDWIDENGVTPWVTATRNLLNNTDNYHINVIMWSWCSINGHNITRYLENMEILVAEYSEGGSNPRAAEHPVEFVFMTGHAQGQGEGGFIHTVNEQIRQHCLDNNRILFDFADIENYDPDGTYYYDNPMWDDLDYNPGRTNNWGIEWCAANVGTELEQLTTGNGVDGYSGCGSCAHCGGAGEGNTINCVLKGRGCWWMFASLAGWNLGDGTIYVPDDYPTIQDAVDNATAGDTIIVRDGTYNENVDVDKSLTIQSENGSASTFVQAAHSGDHVFHVTADYVNISGFTLTGTTVSCKAGVHLYYADYCNISDNNASDNYCGIYLEYSDYNTFFDNTMSNNARYGIYIRWNSNYNMVRDAAITTYEGQGGLYVYSLAGQSTSNDIDTSNTINGKPIQFFDGFYKVCSDDQVLYYNDTYSLIHLYDCDNITLYATTMEDSVFLWSITNSHIYNVDASNGWDGIVMWESDSNTFTNITTSYNSATGFYTRYCDYNNFVDITSCYNGDSGVDLYNAYYNDLKNIVSCNNNHGFYVRYGDHNTFNNVTASDNGANGMEFDFDCDYNTINNSYIENNMNRGLHFYGTSELAPDYNLIYNNYFDNTNNAYDEFGNNIWNISETFGINIIDGDWLGGNYWSDYTGTDDDGDGFGNTSLPYNCSGNIVNGGDWLPLADIVYVDDDFNETTPGWQVDHFDTIQDGIDAVEENGNVYVFNGTYVENVVVYKSLKLIGDGTDNVTVEANNPEYHVFNVTADYIHISGFTVTGATGDKKTGVYLSSSNHCSISNINALNNTRGFYLYISSDNTLTNNIMAGNTYNFGVHGDEIYQYVQNIDTSNTVDGKPIYYWVGQQDAQIPSDAGCVGLVTCKNITVKDMVLINNTHPLLLVDTNDSVIENVTALDNYFGIYLKFSDNNMLIDNNASNNYCGIYLEDSNNTLTNNAAFNNSDFGIYLSNSNGNNLTGNTANGNGWYGIELYESNHNLLVDNIANSNGVGSGFVLYYSSYNTFVNNTANSNAFSTIGSPNVGGFLLYLSCDHNVFVNNTANSNGGYGGFVVWSSSYNNITGNNVSSNDIAYGGIFMYSSSDHNNLSGNTVNSNSNHGIYLWSSNYNTLAGNTVNSNNMNGIYMYSSNNNELADNDVLDNSNYGFYLYYSDGNELADNNASDNYRGFNLYSSDSNSLTDNYASNNSYDGIYLSYSNNVNVTDNDIIGNSNMGIYVYYGNNHNLTNNNVIGNNNYGVSVWYSNDNIIENNTIVDNDYQGLNVQYSNNNNLTDNNVSNNNGNGFYLQNSENNNLKGNIMSGNEYNFGIIGNSLSQFIHDIDTSNTVDGKPIYYWVGQQDAQIPSDAGYVGVVNSENITVRDLTLINNREGVLFANTINSTIENVTALDNWHGVYLYSSINNTLLQNNILSNEYYGIDLSYSNHNALKNNNVSDNDKGVYLSYSDDNNLSSNNVSDNINLGFSIWHSSDNLIINNTLADNGLYGAYLYYSSNNNLTNNTAFSNDNYGMYLQSSSDNVFVGNNASNNSLGGIRLHSSSNRNTLADNTVNSNSQHGIYIYSSSDNNVTDNTAVLNSNYGIYLHYGGGNTVTDNNVSDNGNGIHLTSSNNNEIVDNNASDCTDGIYLDGSSGNNLTGNVANFNLGYGIYIDGPCNGNTLIGNTANSNNNYGIRLYDSCSDTVLIDNIANSNNHCGFSLVSSGDNTLTGNSASGNSDGICLDLSDNNNLTNNTLNSNYGYGVYLTSSNSNNIYDNYFDNTNNAYDDGVNFWNISKTSGTNIIGGDWLGGNYWSDYTGVDIDGDALGDTPYDISGGGGNQDLNPLCEFSNFAPALSGENPMDNAEDVNTTLSTVNVTITDADGDPIDWTIETSPYIGSNSANGDSGGNKVCSVSALSYNTTYTWFVNVTDGTCWINEVYTFTTECSPPDWYPGWSYRKEITIDHSLVSEDLSDFPVLVHWDSDSDLVSHAQSSGDDIVFTDQSGAKLSHEIESYDGATGELDAWVKVPSLSGTVDTVLYMYYGNLSCGSQEDVENVWDDDYAMVQHLDETSGDHYDSTSNDNDGSPVNSVDQSASGKIDGADDFDGIDSYVHASDANSLDLTVEGTLEAWIKMDSVKTYGGIIHKGDLANWSDEAYALQFWTGGKASLYLMGSGSYRLDTVEILSTDVWYHVVGMWNASGMYLYVNGAMDNSKAGTYSVRNTSGGVNIGAQLTEYYSSSWKNFPFDGVIDEIRISSSDRGDGWIETSYNTAASPDTFVSIGSEQTPGNTVPSVSDEIPADGAVGVGLVPVLKVKVDDADNDTLTAYWYSNSSGSWVLFGTNSSIDTSSGFVEISQVNSNFSGYSTTYYWSVRVTDGTTWTNKTYSFTTESEPAGWYPGWSYRKEITIDHSLVSEDLSDFPVLIHWDSDGDLVSHAQSSGDDIVFTDQSGAKLSHEIESYDGATGELDAWVKVPSLSGTVDTVLYMYYGNLSCGSQEDVENVWDDDYAMVQHLDETSGDHYDSTSNDNDGSPVNSVDQSASGKIDGADDFDGIDSYVHASDANSLDLTVEGTLEAWIKMDSVKTYGGIIHKGDLANWSDEAYALQFWTGGKACLYLMGSGSYRLDTVEILSTDVWYHVVGMWNASGMYLYVNGAMDNSKAGTYSVRNTSGGVNIGAQLTEYYSSSWKNFPFDGVIDEIRISSSDRGDGWIETSYNTAASPDTFVSIGSEQTPGNTVPSVSDEIPADGAVGVGLVPVLKIKVDDADNDTLTAYWYSNSSGSWVLFGTNSSIDTSSGFVEISQVNSNFSGYSTTYYWSVRVTDGTTWTNKTYSFTTESEPAGWYPGWSYRKEITIDHSLVSEDLSDFPVLIHWDSDGDLVSHAQSSGDDIVFTDQSGAKLSHEIESYDGATGELDAWVKVPSLSGTVDTVLYMYYGNLSCGSQEDVENVWDDDYAMVQHLDETSGDHYDSTSNNDGSPVNSVDQSASGKIDGADDFDGIDSYVHASDANSLDLTVEGTLEAWIKMDSVKTYGGIIHKGDLANWSDEAYALQFWTGGKACLYLMGSGSYRLDTVEILSTDVWYHVVGMWNASGMYLYVNGAMDNSKAGTYSVRNTSGGVNIGAQLTEYYTSSWKNFPFDGVIDEIRISSSDRGDGWIETSYNTAASPDTFLSVGGEENQPPS